MKEKLTLSLDKETIEWAKEYSKETGTSLSSLVKNYFMVLKGSILKNSANGFEAIDPKVEELSGILSEKSVVNWKDDRDEYLRQKYS